MPESAKPNSSCADVPSELVNHPKYRILRELGRGGMGVVYPEGLWRVVSRLLAKEPRQRYQKPSEVVQALAPFVKGTLKSSPPPLPTTPLKRRQHVATPQAVLPETMAEGVATIAYKPNRAGLRPSRKPLAAALAVVLLLVGLAGLCAVLVSRGKPTSSGNAKTQPPDDTDRPFVAKFKEVAGIDLVRIPAGEFYMGFEQSDADAFDDEKPRHKVRISSPFWLAKYKVTVGQFKRFVASTNYETEAEAAI